MGKVLGAGSLIVDITGYSDHLPVAGETALGQRLKMGPGGKGNNQMTAASRAGAQTRIISRLGNDFLSQIMKKHYDEEKMSTEYITVSDGCETGSALIEVNTSSADNRIIVIKGACDKITAEDVYAAEKDFIDCDVVLTQLETSFEAVLACKELAEKYKKPFILNPAPFQKIPAEFFRGINYLTPNETETEFFTGISVTDDQSAEKAAKRLVEMGVENVIITLGARGAFFFNSRKSEIIPSIKVNAVDTTGAGDAFNGGFAAALAEGLEIGDALRFANCTGALSVTNYGTAPAMPTRQEILKFMKENY